MQEILDSLRGQLDELDGLVHDLDDDGWNAGSLCPGWTVSDVLLHLAQTNDAATASATGRWQELTAIWNPAGAGTTVDDRVGAVIERTRGQPGATIHADWRRSADDMVAAFAACDPKDRLPWVVGDMAARTLATTRIAETWIHTRDIAHGLGMTVEPTDRLWHVARLVHRTIPYAFARDGIGEPGAVRFVLDAPSGDRWEFGDAGAATEVRGPAVDLCWVAGQRADATETALTATGPDADAVLGHMRTFA